MTAAVLLFTKPGFMFTMNLLHPNDPRFKPDSFYRDKVEQMPEVEIFLSKPSSFYEATLKGEDPIPVIYQVVKADVLHQPIGDPTVAHERSRLIVYVNDKVIRQNITLFCSYGQNTTQPVDHFVVHGDNVLRYLLELKEQYCWDLPPPEYRDSPNLSVSTRTIGD